MKQLGDYPDELPQEDEPSGLLDAYQISVNWDLFWQRCHLVPVEEAELNAIWSVYINSIGDDE